MRNKALAISSIVIPYNPIYRKHLPQLKSTSTSLLFNQLEYWFATTEGDKFYKYLSPCPDQEDYREGDSWTEELAFSKDEFRTAFKNIGISYKSKREFDNSQDRFKGSFYCSYYDRIERKTFYLRNHDLVDNTIDEIHRIAKVRSSNTRSQYSHVNKANTYKSAKPTHTSRQSQRLNVDKGNFDYIDTEITNKDYIHRENKLVNQNDRLSHSQAHIDSPRFEKKINQDELTDKKKKEIEYSSQPIRVDQKKEKKEKKSSAKRKERRGDFHEYSKAKNLKPIQDDLSLIDDLRGLCESKRPRHQKINLALANNAFMAQCLNNHFVPAGQNKRQTIARYLGVKGQFESEVAIYLKNLDEKEAQEKRAIEAKRIELERQKEEERIKAIEASKTKEEKVAETIVGLKRQIEVQRRGLRKLPEGFHAVIQKKIDTLLATIERLQGGLNARTAAV